MQKSTEIEQLSDRLVELQSELDTVNASIKNQDSSEATMELEAELKVCMTTMQYCVASPKHISTCRPCKSL